MVDRIAKQLGIGNTPYNIYIDLSKAFDTVDHRIIIEKLKCYGLGTIAIKLIESYLSNRKQFVSLNGFNSNLLLNTCGVPQDSILGPLLFIFYLNDFYQCTHFFNFLIYADDTTLMGTADKRLVKNNVLLSSIINNELEKVNLWLIANKLSINVQKTKFTFFIRLQKSLLYLF